MKILGIDIETAPNTAHVWGLWQQNVGIPQLLESGYTLCWSAKWIGEDEIFFASIYEDGEIEMLNKLWELLDEADAVVHYNGTKFDIPTINKEFLLNDYLPPSPYKQIDLLQATRKNFKFPSNRLDYVCQALGIGEKHSHIGHELWIRCMNDDAESWEEMKTYNIQDVHLLEALYYVLLPWLSGHPNHALYADEDRPVCTNCGSDHVQSRGYTTTKVQKYRRFQCMDCGTWMRSRFTAVEAKDRHNILRQEPL